MAYDDGLRAYEVKKPFEGVMPNLERRYKETESDWAREEISRYMSETPCAACGGQRLKPEALAVKIAGFDIGEATALSVAGRRALVRRAAVAAVGEAERDRGAHPEGDPRPPHLPRRCRARIPDARRAPPARCPAARASASASPSQIGSGLTGVLYVLDEPSIGLHQRDNERLLGTLQAACATSATR